MEDSSKYNIRVFLSISDVDSPSDGYVDALQTLERRLTSIDKYLTNDYIEEHLFSRNKNLLKQNRYQGVSKSNVYERKSAFKNLFT